MKKCPFCAEDIQDAAIVCRHCGRDLPAAPRSPTPADQWSDFAEKYRRMSPEEMAEAWRGLSPEQRRHLQLVFGLSGPKESPGFDSKPAKRRRSGNLVGCLAVVFGLLLILVVGSLFRSNRSSRGSVESPTATPAEKPVGTQASTPGSSLTVVAQSAVLRAFPSAGSAEVGRVVKGDELTMTTRREDWIQVETRSKDPVQGWVHKTVVRSADELKTKVPDAPAPKPKPSTQPEPPDEPAPSKWAGGESGTSAMDDSPTVVYLLDAEGEIQLWLKTFRPTLVARCKENSTDLYMKTGGASSVEYGDHGHTVQIRFDDGKRFTQSWSDSTDNEALFAPNPIALMRRIAKANTMLVRFTPFNASPVVVEFDVRGFDERIGKLAETCHWKP